MRKRLQTLMGLIGVLAAGVSLAASEVAVKQISSPVGFVEIAKMLGGLAFIIAILFLTLHIMKRLQQVKVSNQHNAIKIVSGLNMGVRDKLVLVEVNNTQILLSVTPGDINSLHVFDSKEKSSFDSTLQKVEKGEVA